MNIKRVKYKLNENDDWSIGYTIGEYDGQNKVLLNDKFEYVPRIIEKDKSFVAYDIQDDLEKRINLTLDI